MRKGRRKGRRRDGKRQIGRERIRKNGEREEDEEGGSNWDKTSEEEKGRERRGVNADSE